MTMRHHRGPDYGPKMAAHIETVDPKKRIIQARLKDTGIIQITTVGIPTTFVWPKVGEYWLVRKDTGHWKLDSKYDLKADFTVEDLNSGEARIAAEQVRVSTGDYLLIPYYGSFYDTTSSVTATTTAKVLTYNHTDISNGVSIVNNSKIKIAHAGIYNIQFSTQLENSNTSLQDIEIWLRKNGSDVANSNTLINVPIKHGSNNPGHTLAAWNFFVNNSANDYYEIAYAIPSSNAAGAVTIITTNSETVGPVVPATILTVSRVG